MSGAQNARPHLLYVAFAYPPSTASSVYRCLAVPNAFAAAGWDVTVLTIDGETWSQISGLDSELLQSVDPAIRVVRVSDGGSEDRAKGNLRAFSRLRVEAPYVWERLLSARSRRSFPEAFHGLWLKPASSAALDIHRQHPVDLAIGSASPYVSFAVARSLPGVPYVMDYRDAWAFHTFTGRQNFSPESRMGKLETKFLIEALQIWFVNDQIRDEYARRYPAAASRMRVVPNGFDPQPGHSRPVVRAVEKPAFGYLGTLQHENNPLEELLDGWVDAFAVTEAGDEPVATAQIRGKLSSSGSVSPQLLRRLDGVRQHGLEYGGPVPKRRVAQFYQQLDALILLLPAGKYVTGGKTAEYLATGLPIVSVHEQSNATTDMLRDYPLWFPAQELTAPAISAAFRACAEALRAPDEDRWAAAWDYGQSFLRSATMVPVIEELRRIVRPALPEGTPLGTIAHAGPTSPGRSDPVVPQPGALGSPSGPGAPNAPREVKVLVVMDEGSPEALHDLRARAAAIDGVSASLVAFAADDTRMGGEGHGLSLMGAGPAERRAQRLVSARGLAGVVGRLLRDNLRSRRLSRSVLDDRSFMEELFTADVVLAADAGATRAVWQLRSRTGAELVKGAVALVHVLRR